MIYDEPYVSEEQMRKYDLLVALENTINEEVSKKRNAVINTLLDDEVLVSKKKLVITDYINSRIHFQTQNVVIDGKSYTYNDVVLIANELFDDKTFAGNDSEKVIDGKAFYENSISFEDVIISFHNYRLKHDEESLWWLSRMLCRYIYTVLDMDSKYVDVSFEKNDSIEAIRKLANYVVDFWDRYLKDEIVDTYKLNDDKKRDISEKITQDAYHFFASEDAISEYEKKQIDAKYAAELISQCSKSIYLLLSTLKEVKEKDFSRERNELRRVVVGFCYNIYRDNYDSYGELEDDCRLNSIIMNEIENQNEIRLFKYTLQTELMRLRGCDVETTLNNRQNSLQEITLTDSEELIEEFVKEFSNLVIHTVSSDLVDYYNRIKYELGSKYILLSKGALNTLASAECLYDMFVRTKAPEGFDYSGIAVLYFQAFETAYDELLIEPYSNWLEKENVDQYFRNIKGNFEEIKQYFSETFDAKYFYQKHKFVKCLEIGKFQRFIDLSRSLDCKTGETASKLIYYLENVCFGKKIDKDKITNFAQAVKNATIPRNRAAHGLHGLKEIDVIQDKLIVYDETDVKNVLDFKNLLYAFLEFYN